MEKVPNRYHYEVEVFIHPMSQNSKSDLRYERKYSSSAKENARLLDEEFEESDTHVWNIIATLGHGVKYDDMAVCFDKSSSKYRKREWNLRDMTYDDGHTWDEYLHYPAYQDVYFTNPFNELCDLFSYSFEDLCNINVRGELTTSRIRIVFQPAKLPNEIAPNCQTILRQIAKFAL